ncbi:hypothetical protein WA1_18805 [Scytonema hofmannii PCC 7110]|uniref:Uncharacterized protein n=1 Tax=Scytonema hofmannii PCC 7110 TaxID=128403 RepID=A0A139XBM8_9CYAN|nr:hypothetical protein [Scytonema hofmannii]KYC42053.1 hypothetical protein WA1_18805 [Scytonema hofmannii PCC 7110]
MTRRLNDFYPTPAWATQELIKRVPIIGVILEPCAGQMDISKRLDSSVDRLVFSSDLTWDNEAPRDATKDAFWDYWSKETPLDWVVTNPPFTHAAEILIKAYDRAQIGCTFLLRLSFLEPCNGRANFLAKRPPNYLIVLPRISFTGDGRVDNCTCAWFVWIKGCQEQTIAIVPKDAPQGQLSLDLGGNCKASTD